MCHYCDFAKTANFDRDKTDGFFRQLTETTQQFLRLLERPHVDHFETVYFGGGTPSLFSSEIESFMSRIGLPSKGQEVTLEANPDDVNHRALATWKRAGVNRLSIGVQSFDSSGLKFLTRTHSAEAAKDAVRLCKDYFDNINVDLIYGWPGQTLGSWERDLQTIIDLGIQHVSLYSLTYEGNTVFAKRHRRQVITAMPTGDEEELYHTARRVLVGDGFVHEEVSNFAKPHALARHNELYWQGGYYVGIGPGAHGYLPPSQTHPHGVRYGLPRQLRTFTQPIPHSHNLGELLDSVGAEVEDRGLQEYMLEIIGTGLRTMRGINIEFLEKYSGLKFIPNKNVQQALDENMCILKSGKFLVLNPDEWFRETAWAVEVSLSFRE